MIQHFWVILKWKHKNQMFLDIIVKNSIWQNQRSIFSWSFIMRYIGLNQYTWIRLFRIYIRSKYILIYRMYKKLVSNHMFSMLHHSNTFNKYKNYYLRNILIHKKSIFIKKNIIYIIKDMMSIVIKNWDNILQYMKSMLQEYLHHIFNNERPKLNIERNPHIIDYFQKDKYYNHDDN